MKRQKVSYGIVYFIQLKYIKMEVQKCKLGRSGHAAVMDITRGPVRERGGRGRGRRRGEGVGTGGV